MGFFSLFKKKAPLAEPADLSQVKADMHSHILPGIDDGSPDLSVSIEMIRMLYSVGYRKIITTPHVMSDYYRNSSDTIRKGEESVKEAMLKEGIEIQFEASAEYYLDHELENRVKKKDILTFGNNHLLFELPFISPPEHLGKLVFEMQLAGYKPILAHPERYGYWHRTPQMLEELHDKGVLLQVNLLSFLGHYGLESLRAAESLVEKGLISFVGTDAHHPEHIRMFPEIRSHSLNTLISSGKLLNTSL